jgi:hypothetical protein
MEENMNLKLETAKSLISKHMNYGRHGLFNCPNLVGDEMITICDKLGLVIRICYDYGYFEVFGLSDEEFKE